MNNTRKEKRAWWANHIKAAVLPQHPIAKSMASIGLLAWIIVAKYMDGLLLYRLENILKRYGGDG